MRTKENYFLSQPHQPFFLLGIVNAVIMMLLFGLNYKGILPLDIDPLTLHSYSLIYLVFTNFFTGFLFTTFPRFNQTDTIDKGYYTKIFYANTAASVLFILGALFWNYLLTFAMLTAFVSQFFIILKLTVIYKNANTPDKEDSFWILGANHIGLFAHLLFIISIFIPAILNTAINSAFYLYLIFLAFSVGQRMIPFFSHSFAQKGEHFVRNVFILFVLKFIFSISEFKALELIVDIALALYLGREFYHWELHPFHSPAILWVLHLALFWLPISFALSALSLTAELFLDTSFYFFNVHLLAIGFLTTVLIGFGTRVTLGHAGMPPHADKFVTALFFFIQLVVLLRALYSFNIAFRWDMNSLFDISFTAWLLLFVLWGSRYSKILIFGKKV
ncbi:NnrS protein involved in response to NO [hydrothermal vent metagenome]|uniref:NnrS protein involved in response to NO n=1 Tax=hydrothermal vent metagenome TaxID=652676 RepID=A0A1W1BL40_9ZZZZ